MKKSGMFIGERASRAKTLTGGNTSTSGMLVFYWRASEASETLQGVNQSRFAYIYFIYLFMGYVRPLFSPGLLIT